MSASRPRPDHDDPMSEPPAGFDLVAARTENFVIRVDADRGVVLIALSGFRSDDKAGEALQMFAEFYAAQPHRKIIFDYRAADYPDDLYALIERYSKIAVVLPRSRIVAVKGDSEDPIAVLGGQAMRAAGHDVVVVAHLDEALKRLSKPA